MKMNRITEDVCNMMSRQQNEAVFSKIEEQAVPPYSVPDKTVKKNV